MGKKREAQESAEEEKKVEKRPRRTRVNIYFL